MEKYISLLILTMLAIFHVSGQSIAFTYDNDGNMESRYVVTLKGGTIEENPSEIVSIELDEQKITVYPNPTKGEICVKILPLKHEEESFMRLFDSAGHLLEIKKIISEQTYLEISGNPGVYLLNIHLGTNISKWKIIKQ